MFETTNQIIYIYICDYGKSPFYSWVNHLFWLGHFQSQTASLPEGNPHLSMVKPPAHGSSSGLGTARLCTGAYELPLTACRACRDKAKTAQGWEPSFGPKAIRLTIKGFSVFCCFGCLETQSLCVVFLEFLGFALNNGIERQLKARLKAFKVTRYF